LRGEPKNPSSYFSNRTILSPTNDVATPINMKMIEKITTPEMSYYSLDSIDDSSANHSTMKALYLTEFLNTLSINGLPDHVLHLKIGVPIMLLRNLDPSRGLCNGTRLIVTKFTSRVIDGEIITRKAKGAKAYIPRIITTSVETICPFKLSCRQFPIKVPYAMTLNKSQGQTLSTVGVYLLSPVFSHG
jgi:ATP-dependent DNA helicase PIF1